MAHYAYIDENNIVTQVIVGRDEEDLPEGVASWEEYFSSKGKGRALRTSYNTIKNTHLQGGTPFRGNFATVGGTYDEALDVFLAPKPYNSWVLNEDCYCWEPPIAYPEDDGGVMHDWNEEVANWTPVE